jgi:hypothetical protein
MEVLEVLETSVGAAANQELAQFFYLELFILL